MSYYTYILAKYDISDCKTFEDVKSKFPDARPAFLRKVIYLKDLRITKDGRLTKGTPKELNLMHRGLLDHHKREDHNMAELEKLVRMSEKQKAFVHISSTPCACCEHLVHRNERYSCIRNRVIPEYVSSVWATKCVAFKQKKPLTSDEWNIVPQFRTSISPMEAVAFNKYKLEAVPVEYPDAQEKTEDPDKINIIKTAMTYAQAIAEAVVDKVKKSDENLEINFEVLPLRYYFYPSAPSVLVKMIFYVKIDETCFNFEPEHSIVIRRDTRQIVTLRSFTREVSNYSSTLLWLIDQKRGGTISKILDRLSERLPISADLRKHAEDLIVLMRLKGFGIGRRIESLLAAAVVVASRSLGTPISVSEVSQALEITERLVFNVLQLVPNVTIPRIPSAIEFVHGIIVKLGLSETPEGEKLRREALTILERTRDILILRGKNPRSLAAAAIYIAAKDLFQKNECNFMPAQREIAEAADITEVTLRNVYHDLEKFL